MGFLKIRKADFVESDFPQNKERHADAETSLSMTHTHKNCHGRTCFGFAQQAKVVNENYSPLDKMKNLIQNAFQRIR